MKKYLPLLILPLLLAACRSSGSPSLAGGTLPDGEWRIVRIDDKPVSGSDYRLTVNTRAQTLSAYFGCNRIHAQYRELDEQVAIGNIASTLMYCGTDTDEARGLDALEHSSRWRLEGAKTVGGQRLTFFDHAGQPRLEMQSR